MYSRLMQLYIAQGYEASQLCKVIAKIEGPKAKAKTPAPDML